MHTNRILPWGILLIAGCASDPMAGNDPHVTAPFAWCADEARAAASQPLPKDASSSQRRAARDFHMSKACQRAYEHKTDLPFPVVPSRLP
jgi:hypothetical protein